MTSSGSRRSASSSSTASTATSFRCSRYVVETERRFYLANQVEIHERPDGWLEVELGDAWVWDMFRPARFVSNVRVMTRRDVNVEELRKDDNIQLPE